MNATNISDPVLEAVLALNALVAIALIYLMYLLVKIKKEEKERKRNQQITAGEVKLSPIDYHQGSDNVE